MNRRAVAALIAGAALAAGVACGDDGGDGDPTPVATRPVATRTSAPAATPANATPRATSGAADEVTGIVGAVNAAARTIEITRTAGADVQIVEVTPQTRIRGATGARVAFSEIRPSNRIIARGSVDASSGALVADEIDVQDAFGPGPAPGG